MANLLAGEFEKMARLLARWHAKLKFWRTLARWQIKMRSWHAFGTLAHGHVGTQTTLARMTSMARDLANSNSDGCFPGVTYELCSKNIKQLF